jgi:endonuclease/exonuclease/phosphatase family metal-dependent hydrolase
MIKLVLKLTGGLICALVILFAVFLIYVTAVDYKPAAQVALTADKVTSHSLPLKQGVPFSVTTFNIGYAGLDRAQDFFMDGGTQSRSSSKKQTEDNLSAISAHLQELESDLYLLQEVDVAASRSYHMNEVDLVKQALPLYSSIFALNYKVPWVPVPVMRPMGAVESGLVTLSKLQSSSHTRYDLPGKESWPVQQMELDRAFISSRFPVEGGKELVVIHLHLSAFDEGGDIRKQQLNFLSDYIDQEIVKGSYLLLGGDWNHSLPGTEPDSFDSQQAWPNWLQPFPNDFTPEGFEWAVDPAVPSVRTLDIPYQSGINFLAVVDGFLVSPNIEIVSVQGHDLGFESSDHNPVTGRFILQ